MWPELPLEFNVVGTPVSAQSGNAKAKEEWKLRILEAALSVIGGDRWAFHDTRLAVMMFYFPQTAMLGDIDNIVKLTLDALSPKIYLDDGLIDRVLVQRFDPIGRVTFAAPSDTLIAALASGEPILYIKVAEVPLGDVAA